ncbi:MAG: alpha/beta hydrolase [Gemmatimonadales bacterium]
MVEHHLTVPRTARYFTLGPAAARDVWFVLHGYGQLAGRFLRQFAPLDDGTRYLIAPEGLSRFYLEAGRNDKIGASWMTREDRLMEIGDYVRHLDAVRAEAMRDRPEGRVTVLGFSQGTATAARWLVQGSARADHLVLWGGEVPPDLDLAMARERWSRTVLTFVAGSADPFITAKVLARDEQRLREHTIAYRVERFEGGHEIRADVLERIAQ